MNTAGWSRDVTSSAGRFRQLIRALGYFRPDAGRVALTLGLLLFSIGLNLLKPWPLALVVDHLRANRAVGVPYSDEMIENARADLLAQSNPDADTTDFLARYPKAAVGNLDGNPRNVTEMDALVAYLQILGRMVDFTDVRIEDLTQ